MTWPSLRITSMPAPMPLSLVGSSRFAAAAAAAAAAATAAALPFDFDFALLAAAAFAPVRLWLYFIRPCQSLSAACLACCGHVRAFDGVVRVRGSQRAANLRLVGVSERRVRAHGRGRERGRVLGTDAGQHGQIVG